jgi:hypothetical protein
MPAPVLCTGHGGGHVVRHELDHDQKLASDLGEVAGQ